MSRIIGGMSRDNSGGARPTRKGLPVYTGKPVTKEGTGSPVETTIVGKNPSYNPLTDAPTVTGGTGRNGLTMGEKTKIARGVGKVAAKTMPGRKADATAYAARQQAKGRVFEGGAGHESASRIAKQNFGVVGNTTVRKVHTGTGVGVIATKNNMTGGPMTDQDARNVNRANQEVALIKSMPHDAATRAIQSGGGRVRFANDMPDVPTPAPSKNPIQTPSPSYTPRKKKK